MSRRANQNITPHRFVRKSNPQAGSQRTGVAIATSQQRAPASFRIFQNQPAQRSRAVELQLHRFMGTIGERKARYASALVDALGPNRAPRPLDRLLASV
ncbi:hypothetical protein BKA04_001368 [Cryobacterium mesophilum]|uniref:hypothetical protein n=1 Tax=Terrimesophilobacter mesophilus TaxID=433647 RepID=UPI000CE3B9E5|nr:hypothetical protein [Terrimesophilobacter mesophilus]MBB5633145.1 hypothetical protein [Terrimesophilobacter mesophilus]